MEILEIYCPTCQAVCPAANININALVAKCDHCDTVFRLPQDQPESVNQLPPSRPAIIQKIDDLDAGFKLQWRWWSLIAIPLILFCVVWDGFLFFWYAIAFNQLKAPNFEFWLMTLFPVGHVCVGIGITYYATALLLNRTTISIDRGILAIRHGPIRWPQPDDLETADIRGLEVELSGWSVQGAQASGTGLRYRLAAQDQEGRQIILLRSLPADQARYLAYELASYLNVPCRENHSAAAFSFGSILDGFRRSMPGQSSKRADRRSR